MVKITLLVTSISLIIDSVLVFLALRPFLIVYPNAIVRMMARRGFHSIVNYLDDFLIIGNTQAECQQGLVTLISLLHSLGSNVSWEKVVSPSQRVTFLGIELHCYVSSPPSRQV